MRNGNAYITTKNSEDLNLLLNYITDRGLWSKETELVKFFGITTINEDAQMRCNRVKKKVEFMDGDRFLHFTGDVDTINNLYLLLGMDRFQRDRFDIFWMKDLLIVDKDNFAVELYFEECVY